MKPTYGEIFDEGQALRDAFLLRVAGVKEVISDLGKSVPPCSLGSRVPGRALKKEILAWSKRWHVEASWLHDSAFQAVRYWCSTDVLSYSAGSFAPLEPSSLHLPPPEGFPIYFPASMKRAEYIRLAKKEVRAAVQSVPILGWVLQGNEVWDEIKKVAEAYCDKSEQYFKRRKAIIRKRLPNLERDLDWTVRYQLMNEEFRSIAVKDNESQDTVEKAVARMLRDLNLRPRNPRGRRKGSKASYGIVRRDAPVH